MNLDFKQGDIDFMQVGFDFMQIGLDFRERDLDFQQAGKMLVRIFDIKRSKLGICSFEISLP